MIPPTTNNPARIMFMVMQDNKRFAPAQGQPSASRCLHVLVALDLQR
jgi:hypothetical protein